MIEMQSVSSSNIDAIGYDAANEVLRIRFHGGGTYDYQGVSETTFKDLKGAASVGKYFFRYVKDQYPTVKV